MKAPEVHANLRYYPRWAALHTKKWVVCLLQDDGSPPLFSERYGYVKVWRFIGLKLKYWGKEYEKHPS